MRRAHAGEILGAVALFGGSAETWFGSHSESSGTSESDTVSRTRVLEQLEKITGSQSEAARVYEQLELSHSDPAELLAETPEKLANKMNQAVATYRLAHIAKRALSSTASEGAVGEVPVAHTSSVPTLVRMRHFVVTPSVSRDVTFLGAWLLLACMAVVAGLATTRGH